MKYYQLALKSPMDENYNIITYTNNVLLLLNQ